MKRPRATKSETNLWDAVILGEMKSKALGRERKRKDLLHWRKAKRFVWEEEEEKMAASHLSEEEKEAFLKP